MHGIAIRYCLKIDFKSTSQCTTILTKPGYTHLYHDFKINVNYVNPSSSSSWAWIRTIWFPVGHSSDNYSTSYRYILELAFAVVILYSFSIKCMNPIVLGCDCRFSQFLHIATVFTAKFEWLFCYFLYWHWHWLCLDLYANARLHRHYYQLAIGLNMTVGALHLIDRCRHCARHCNQMEQVSKIMTERRHDLPLLM